MTRPFAQGGRDDDDLLAAEFALGLLDPVEAESVQVRARTDAPLSLRIAWWRDQLAPLAGELETTPPRDLWPTIAARLPGNDNADAKALGRWRAAAIGATGLAAALLLALTLRPGPSPAPVPVPQAPPMIAAIAGENGTVVAVSYDVRSANLLVAPTVLDPGTGDAELWIIPEGGAPRSLGVVAAKQTAVRTVPQDLRPLIAAGATFAISREARGGSVTGAPLGPVIASGKIVRT
ncbi:MAG: anti-sigma factor domain-containing protein [Sphingomonadaceae bacterium]